MDAHDNFDPFDPFNFGMNSSKPVKPTTDKNNTPISSLPFNDCVNNNSHNNTLDPFDALTFQIADNSPKTTTSKDLKKEQPILDDFGGLFGDLTCTTSSTNTRAPTNQPHIKQPIQQLITTSYPNNTLNKTTKPILTMPFLDLNINNYLMEWLEFIRFDVDTWNEQRVYEWIKSLNTQQLWKHKRYSFGNYNIQQVWKYMRDLSINGQTLRTIHTTPSSLTQKHISPLMFGFQEIMLTQLFIHRKPTNLYINRDTILPANHEYVFDNIYIKHCTLKIHTRGILVLKALNNIILENGNIDLSGTKSYSLPWKSAYENCTHSGKPDEYDKVSVGKRGSNGDSCCGGGIGGNGLRLECDKLILCKNSMISLGGGSRLHECGWGCQDGEDGKLLLVCNQIKIEDGSRIDRKPRIVVNSIDMKGYKQMKLCLLYGYMRVCMKNRMVVDVICNILDRYLIDERDKSLFGRNHVYWVKFVDLERYRVETDKEEKKSEFDKKFYTGVDNNNPSVFVGMSLRQSEQEKVSKSVKELMTNAYKKGNEQNAKVNNPFDNWFI